MTHSSESLRTDPMWKELFSLAKYVYDELEKEPNDFPEGEEWNTKSKLRNAVNDSVYSVAKALGNWSKGGAEYEWNGARKSLAGLLSMYVLAGKRHFLNLDPEIVVRIETLISQCGQQVVAEREAAKLREQEELEPWMEKYRIYEKLHGANGSEAK